MSETHQPSPKKCWIKTLEQGLATIFGVFLILLSCSVVVEAIARKLFNFSLQGADELGGYTLAICCTLAFSVALISRSHIRVDVAYGFFKDRTKAFLNYCSILSILAFSGFVLYLAITVYLDSYVYDSSAPTPWGTPLIYPQLLWVIGLALFAWVALLLTIKATKLALKRDVQHLNDDFQPKSVKEDLAFELSSMESRTHGQSEAQP